MPRLGGTRGRYASRPTQSDPMVVIPEAIYARIVLAAEEAKTSPGMWVEVALRDALKRHGRAMDDAEFHAACRQAEANLRCTPHRHEFEQGRGRRPTDPG